MNKRIRKNQRAKRIFFLKVRVGMSRDWPIGCSDTYWKHVMKWIAHP